MTWNLPLKRPIALVFQKHSRTSSENIYSIQYGSSVLYGGVTTLAKKEVQTTISLADPADTTHKHSLFTMNSPSCQHPTTSLPTISEDDLLSCHTETTIRVTNTTNDRGNNPRQQVREAALFSFESVLRTRKAVFSSSLLFLPKLIDPPPLSCPFVT